MRTLRTALTAARILAAPVILAALLAALLVCIARTPASGATAGLPYCPTADTNMECLQLSPGGYILGPNQQGFTFHKVGRVSSTGEYPYLPGSGLNAVHAGQPYGWLTAGAGVCVWDNYATNKTYQKGCGIYWADEWDLSGQWIINLGATNAAGGMGAYPWTTVNLGVFGTTPGKVVYSCAATTAGYLDRWTY